MHQCDLRPRQGPGVPASGPGGRPGPLPRLHRGPLVPFRVHVQAARRYGPDILRRTAAGVRDGSGGGGGEPGRQAPGRREGQRVGSRGWTRVRVVGQMLLVVKQAGAASARRSQHLLLVLLALAGSSRPATPTCPASRTWRAATMRPAHVSLPPSRRRRRLGLRPSPRGQPVPRTPAWTAASNRADKSRRTPSAVPSACCA